MGINNFRCWVTGYTPSDKNGPPVLVTNYKDKGIHEAMKQANKYVEENYKDGFCIIGSDNFLKCWKLEKGCKANFKKISQNVLLCHYHGYLELDEETKSEIKAYFK